MTEARPGGGGTAEMPQGKRQAGAAQPRRHGVGAVALLLALLCIVAGVPLLIQAIWTDALIRERAGDQMADDTAALAGRIATRLELFGVHVAGVVHAADTQLRAGGGTAAAAAERPAVAVDEALHPLLGSSGIRHVVLMSPDGRIGPCLAPPGATCPASMAWIHEQPDLAERAFQPGSVLFASVARDEAGAPGILLVQPPPRAGGDANATFAWISADQIAAIAEAGGRPQAAFVAVHGPQGRLLYHEDPKLRLTRRTPAGEMPRTQPDPATTTFTDPADGRTYPASHAMVAGLDWTVTAYRRDQGLADMVGRVWTVAAILLGLVAAVAVAVSALAQRTLARLVRQIGGALAAVRQSSSKTDSDPGDGPDPAETAERLAAAAARHPLREVRQLGIATGQMALAVQQRQARDAETVRAARLSNEKRSAFIANISHQLRTPLNSIIGFSEMMTDQLFGPLGHAKYLEYALSVHNSGEYLMRILNDLRDLSRAEIGVLDLEETTLDVGRLLRSSVSIVSREAKVHNVTLSMMTDDDMPVVRGDEQRLQQALINLMNHAVQSSPTDGQVEIAAVIARNGELHVRIHDDGPPIPERDVAKLLTPFDEVQRSYDRRFEGTGLGLPLARTMLDLHGGRLDIRSAANEGNTLTAILPASRVLRQTAA
ncbi:sensor histidine kinase [Marinibaculum pumilum]|uniref:histidine kinase n=1 Tax=Marinibaculum pumilum TaxID=1766165 RepID=A0ABV7L5X6_9PROT